MTTFAEQRTFLRTALRRPSRLGAPAPTGSTLSAALAALAPADRPTTVVELGAGTGAVTPSIRARLAPGSRLVAVEIDPDLVAYLLGTQRELEVLHGDAADLVALLDGAGVGPLDAALCSLPWTLIAPQRRLRMLAAIAASLAPGGVFATITTCTALPARVARFRDELAATFGDVAATPIVWRNLPPARLLVCRGVRSC